MLADSQIMQAILGNYHEQQGHQGYPNAPDEPRLVFDNHQVEDMVGEWADATPIASADLKGFRRE